MSIRRVIAYLAASILILSAAALFALLEFSSNAREDCSWTEVEQAEQFCSDYEGAYGIVSASLFLIWLAMMWVINRRRKVESHVQ